MDENSLSFKELIEVYSIGGQVENQGEDIAKFWDCNPYVSHHRGHAMFATKKITPGGHWMEISSIATSQWVLHMPRLSMPMPEWQFLIRCIYQLLDKMEICVGKT